MDNRKAKLKILLFFLSSFSMLLTIVFYCEGAELPGGTKDDEIRQEKTKPGARQEQSTGAMNEYEARSLERQTRRALGSYHEKVCVEMGLVRYHGKCMKAEEKAFLFDIEVRHVENLLHEAILLYQAATPEEVAFAFDHAENFIDKFELDEVIDERITEKTILLLGFIFRPADKWNREMREALRKDKLPKNPIDFLKRQKKTEDFSEQVYIPLMKLLAEQIADYEMQNGKEEFNRLMADNGLGDILTILEYKGETK